MLVKEATYPLLLCRRSVRLAQYKVYSNPRKVTAEGSFDLTSFLGRQLWERFEEGAINSTRINVMYRD